MVWVPNFADLTRATLTTVFTIFEISSIRRSPYARKHISPVGAYVCLVNQTVLKSFLDDLRRIFHISKGLLMPCQLTSYWIRYSCYKFTSQTQIATELRRKLLWRVLFFRHVPLNLRKRQSHGGSKRDPWLLTWSCNEIFATWILSFRVTRWSVQSSRIASLNYYFSPHCPSTLERKWIGAVHANVP